MIKGIESMKMVKTILLISLAAMMSIHVAMAANYTVGGSDGWDQMTDLATWASSQTFVVGDFLLFQYTPNHDVTEVSSANFGPCTDTNPIRRQIGGATVIALTSAGSRYFICTSHCLAGMKVQIDTLAASSPPPSTTPATPSPPPSTTPATPSPPPTTPSPPPKRSPSPKTSPAPPSKKAANNGTTLPPSTAPAPSGALSPPPPAPSSAAKFGVKGSAIAGFAMTVILLSLRNFLLL